MALVALFALIATGAAKPLVLVPNEIGAVKGIPGDMGTLTRAMGEAPVSFNAPLNSNMVAVLSDAPTVLPQAAPGSIIAGTDTWVLQPAAPGTANLTLVWTDPAGTPKQSHIRLVVTPPRSA